MKIVVMKEICPGEARVALVPEHVKQLTKKGLEIKIESNAGVASGYIDDDYIQSGASIFKESKKILPMADVVLRVRSSSLEEVNFLKENCLHISFLDTFKEYSLIQELKDKGISTISMDLIPRITRAQKMDALSSQSSLAGYVAIILASEALNKVFPMMTTPAGTIYPARVFVIGAGVAGLQSIATAKRMGARVEAYDTREVVEEQIKSLGARFLKIDLGKTQETKQGYAKALTPEQLVIQKKAIMNVCSQADVVISCAQVFGRSAPKIISVEMLRHMKNGSVVVDLAVESGGNIEGSKKDETIILEGVKIIGLSNLPARVSNDASQMYSSNLFNVISEYLDEKKSVLNLSPNDEILQECLITHRHQILVGRICEAMAEKRSDHVE